MYPDQFNKTEETAQNLKEDEEEIDARNVDYNPTISAEVARDVLDLSQRITSKILERSDKKFEVFSPISISAALHLALLGANGSTFEELMGLIGYSNSEKFTTTYI